MTNWIVWLVGFLLLSNIILLICQKFSNHNARSMLNYNLLFAVVAFSNQFGIDKAPSTYGLIKNTILFFSISIAISFILSFRKKIFIMRQFFENLFLIWASNSIIVLVFAYGSAGR